MAAVRSFRWRWPLRLAFCALLAFILHSLALRVYPQEQMPTPQQPLQRLKHLTQAQELVDYGNQQEQQAHQQQPEQQVLEKEQVKEDEDIDTQQQRPALTKDQLQHQSQHMLAAQQKTVTCLNSSRDITTSEPANYAAHKEDGDLARLTPVKLWQSGKEQPQQALTIVTAVSLERLPMLRAQCQSWPGHLTAVLYEPTVVTSSNQTDTADDAARAKGKGSSNQAESKKDSSSNGSGSSRGSSQQRMLLADKEKDGQATNQQTPLVEATQAVQQLFQEMEMAGTATCSLSVLLVTELVDESMADQIPLNTLRNHALLLAQTPLVAMLDVDMVVSSSLGQSLAQPKEVEALVQLCRGKDGQAKRVVVLPAFETRPFKSTGLERVDALAYNVASFACQADKKAVRGLVSSRLLGPFNRVVNVPGQAETDFEQWFNFVPDATKDNIAYLINPRHDKFEPWYIMDRQVALQHPYDEIFRGYGKNKISHRHWLSSLGFEFHVHGSAFIVHRLHAESEAKLIWRGQMSQKDVLNTNRLTNLQVAMASKSYTPSLGKSTQMCLQQARPST